MDGSLQTVLIISIASMMYFDRILAVAPLLVQLGDAQSGYGNAAASAPCVKSFVAPSGYPTSIFSSYFPSPTGQEPQPAVYDPVLNITCMLHYVLVEMHILMSPSSCQSHEPRHDPRQ